jgi:hypothetical protein
VTTFRFERFEHTRGQLASTHACCFANRGGAGKVVDRSLKGLINVQRLLRNGPDRLRDR